MFRSGFKFTEPSAGDDSLEVEQGAVAEKKVGPAEKKTESVENETRKGSDESTGKPKEKVASAAPAAPATSVAGEHGSGDDREKAKPSEEGEKISEAAMEGKKTITLRESATDVLVFEGGALRCEPTLVEGKKYELLISQSSGEAPDFEFGGGVVRLNGEHSIKIPKAFRNCDPVLKKSKKQKGSVVMRFAL